MITKQKAAELRRLFSADAESKEFPEEALDYIYEKGLFRLFIPKALGGKQCSLPDAIEIIKECARVDGDFGWAVQIGNGGGFFAGFFEEKTAQKYFTDPKFVIAGSGFPAGKAKATGDAFRVSGQWKYASGSGYATLFTANAVLEGSEKIRAFAFLPEQVQVLDDWNAYGMRKTLSDSIKVEDVEVPAAMSFDTSKVIKDYDYPLYKFPFMEFARACILSTLAGCFRHLLEEFEVYLNGTDAEKRTVLKELHQELNQRDEEQWQHILAAATKAWEHTSTDSAPSDGLVQELDKVMKEHIRFINEQAYQVFSAVGMSATQRNSPINKIWRDLTTAAQHVILKL